MKTPACFLAERVYGVVVDATERAYQCRSHRQDRSDIRFSCSIALGYPVHDNNAPWLSMPTLMLRLDAPNT